MHRSELVAPELLALVAGALLLEEDRTGGGKFDADGAEEPDEREQRDEKEAGNQNVGAALDEFRERRVEGLLMEADDTAQLGNRHLALGVAFHARDVLEADHMVLAGGDQLLYELRFCGGIQRAEDFLDGVVVLLDVGDSLVRRAEVRDVRGDVTRSRREEAQDLVADVVRLGHCPEGRQHVGFRAYKDDGVGIGASPTDAGDDLAHQQVPEEVEDARQDGLQAQELALEDQFVDDGHQPVVQDESGCCVEDGAVGDVHGAASALVDLDPEKPGGRDGADHQQEPGSDLLVLGQVVFAHHACSVEKEHKDSHLDEDVSHKRWKLVEDGFLGGGLDDAQHKNGRDTRQSYYFFIYLLASIKNYERNRSRRRQRHPALSHHERCVQAAPAHL